MEIERTAEARQLEDGTWKESIYYSDEMHDAWRSMKRIAKEKGCKIGLMLVIEKAEVMPFSEVFLSEIEADIERVLEKIKEHSGSTGNQAGLSGHTESDVAAGDK